MSKGDKYRATDKERYNGNYDKIDWGGKKDEKAKRISSKTRRYNRRTRSRNNGS